MEFLADGDCADATLLIVVRCCASSPATLGSIV